jgi:hypothetical protein
MSLTVKDLPGRTFAYKGKKFEVRNTYMLDGQLVIEVPDRNIKIDKSEIDQELEKFKPATLNGETSLPQLTADRRADWYYETTDYDKFVFHRKNRRVNDLHVSELVKSIGQNNLLHAQPILVNEKLEVIDGQHRLAAARQCEVPIYYIIKRGLTIEDAITLNINTKNWGFQDYLDYWVEQGVHEYQLFRDYRAEYQFSFSLCINLIHSGKATTMPKVNDMFRNGELELNHIDYAREIGELTERIRQYGDFAGDRSFVIALDRAMQVEEFSAEQFLEKLEIAPDKFTKCSDTDSYLRMMEGVINYRSHSRIRLY